MILFDEVIKSENPEKIIECMKAYSDGQIKLSNEQINNLIIKICEIGKGFDIYKFACFADEKYADLLADAVIAKLDPYAIQTFAAEIPNAPMERLAKAVVATASTVEQNKNIYNFAKLKNAPVELIVKCVIETEDPYKIFGLAWNVDFVHKEKLAHAMIRSNDNIWTEVFYNTHFKKKDYSFEQFLADYSSLHENEEPVLQ